MKRLFERVREKFVTMLSPRLVTATKAEGDEADEQKLRELLDAFESLAIPVAHELDAVYREAARSTREGLEAQTSITLTSINEAAFRFANERAAELVGRKWVNGELVDNPDAQWAITETTREKLRQLIADAFEEGMTPAELEADIEETGIFSEARAELIASTEMARAQIQGSLGTAKAIGVVGKESELSGDHDIDDECDDAQDMGVVAIDSNFGGLGDGPPFHPRCNCSLVYYTAKDAEARHLVEELQEA